MKTAKVIFWITTVIIFLFEGVMPALTSQTKMAKEGITNLGYPEYFGVILMVFKVCGSIVLIVPQIPARVKEWAYAGFAFDFIAAFVSLWVVYGFHAMLILPLAFMVILIVSYTNYHKLQKAKHL